MLGHGKPPKIGAKKEEVSIRLKLKISNDCMHHMLFLTFFVPFSHLTTKRYVVDSIFSIASILIQGVRVLCHTWCMVWLSLPCSFGNFDTGFLCECLKDPTGFDWVVFP